MGEHEQNPQANLTHFSGVNSTIPSAYDPQPPNLIEASFDSASSTVSPATLTDMVYNVQLCEADLIKRESKIKT